MQQTAIDSLVARGIPMAEEVAGQAMERLIILNTTQLVIGIIILAVTFIFAIAVPTYKLYKYKDSHGHWNDIPLYGFEVGRGDLYALIFFIGSLASLLGIGLTVEAWMNLTWPELALVKSILN